MHRFSPTASIQRLQSELVAERNVIAEQQRRLKEWVPPDPSRYRTHYDYAHFIGENKQDLRVAVANTEGRIRDLERRIKEADKDDEDLIY